MKTKTCSKTKIVLAVIFSIMLTVSMMPMTASAAAKPAQVKGVKAYKVTTSTISLKWSKAKRAKYYCVYKKIGKKYKKIVTVKGYSKTKYTVKKLKANTKYSFKIRAYKKSGKKTLWGKYSKTYSKTTNKAATPVVNPTRAVTASWNIGAVNQKEPENYSASTATDKVVATLYSDGELAVTGSGNTQVMIVSSQKRLTPWYSNRENIKKQR